MNAFLGISDDEKVQMLRCFNSNIRFFNKGVTIMSNLSNTEILCIFQSGRANVIKSDYNGNISIIVTLQSGDIFESNMITDRSGELSIVAAEKCEVIFIDYTKAINRCAKNCPYHNKFIDNILQIMMYKLNQNYERIQLLTKKTIREKLLDYFKMTSRKKNSKSFKLDMSLSDLADYLSTDRSALMRELKHLKEDKVIDVDGKIFKLLF